MYKPIVKGCKAIVIEAPKYPEMIWKRVQVLCFMGDYLTKQPVDGKQGIVRNAWEINFKGRRIACAERALLRIDDPEIQQQLEREAEIAQPLQKEEKEI